MWENVLDEILRQPVEVEVGSEERDVDAEKFRSPNASRIKYYIEEETDAYAWYTPPSSQPRITYRVKRIASSADKALTRVRSDLSLPPPTKELIKLFRWSFAHFIRRHEWFHYLVNRACRILPEDTHADYMRKVYEERRKAGIGNLEEALADAYAIIYVQDDLSNLPDPKRIPYTRNELMQSFKEILETIFINKRRPPGYREATIFIKEFEILKQTKSFSIEDFSTLIVLSLGDSTLSKAFKGLSWLFHELTVREPKDFKNYSLSPANPYSGKDFLLFLENLRRDDTLLVYLLPPPEEEAV